MLGTGVAAQVVWAGMWFSSVQMSAKPAAARCAASPARLRLAGEVLRLPVPAVGERWAGVDAATVNGTRPRLASGA